MSKATHISYSITLSILCVLGLACSQPSEGLFLGLSVSPSVVDFGAVPVNSVRQLELRIANPSQQRVDYRLSLDSMDVFSFEISGDMALEPQEEAKITVTFAPTQPGEQSTNLEIKNSASDRSTVVNLTGTAVQSRLTATPDEVDFGPVVLGTVATRTFILTNGSAADVVVESTQLNGVKACGSPGPELFCLVPPQAGAALAYPIAANSSIEVKAQFTSDTIEGSRERASFKAAACELDECEIEVVLNAIPVVTGFSCNDPLDFGGVNPGSCADRKLDCTNTANVPVTVRSWALSADSSPDFEVSSGTGRVLTTDEPFLIDVRYCPDRFSRAQARLDIVLDELNTPFSVQLLGAGGGPDIEVSNNVLDFGLTTLVAPTRRSLVIVNVGPEDLLVTEILVDTNGTSSFSLVGGAVTIAPGSSETVVVEFLPVREGLIESSLIIRSNDADESDTIVRLVGEGINLPPCSYSVQPAQLNFGYVIAGQSLTRHVEVRNEGPNDCLIGSVLIEPGSDFEFSADARDEENRILSVGSSTTLATTYTPQGGAENQGGLSFSISDPLNPNPRVPLLGVGVSEGLIISPREIDFGAVNAACASPDRPVHLINNGQLPTTIDSISLVNGSNSAFSISSLPAPLPGASVQLMPTDSIEFTVSATGRNAGQLAGAVEISGSFAGQPVDYVVPLRIDVTIDASIEERFGPTNSKTDILFVVDNSCSLGQEHVQLAETFERFITNAPMYNLDYQIGITTTDTQLNGEQGRLFPLGAAPDRIITRTAGPDPLTVFRARIQEIGLGGSGIETGLEAAYLALSTPNIGNHNAGFLRPDARLSIVFVTDEPDASPRADSFYRNFFTSIKGGPRSGRLALNVIAGDNPGGCNGPGGTAAAAFRLTGLLPAGDGIFESICNSVGGDVMEHLARWGGGTRTRLWLNGTPVVSTISVLVDGVELPAVMAGGAVNWSYDFGSNRIDFTQFSAPGSAADIAVRYTPICQ